MQLLSIVLRMIMGILIGTALLTAPSVQAATLDSHVVVLDGSGKIIPWTPDPAQGYDLVMDLAWDYLVSGVPSDSLNGKPYYYSYSCLEGDTLQPMDWPHNPAGLYGMLTESALTYYGYSGNRAPVTLAENVATALLDNGMTSRSWNWANVPYASGDAGSLIYRGAAFGNSTGQADGSGVIEPDKVGEMGYAWLQLYRFNGNTRFRDAAIAAADALASHVRSGPEISDSRSPWPFRVYAQTGAVREEYSANVIGPIMLFDGLISQGLGDTTAYQTARQIAWDWMMTYPMQNNVWSNYFEDVAIQPGTGNFNQYSAMMTARYLLQHPEFDPFWERHVRGLILWVENTFAVPSYGANTIREQIQFFYPMGSHTSRYASVNALLFEKTGDAIAREKAYRSLNWATYMARDKGIVIDGPEVNHVWFTDGYGDYIRHFMTSLGAVPDWAPAGQSHLVRSSSVVKNVSYLPNAVSYVTSDGASTEVLRTAFTPLRVTVDGQVLGQRSDLTQPGWTFDPGLSVVRVRHDTGTNIQIVSGTLSAITVTPVNQAIQGGNTQQFTASGTYSDGSTQNITSQTAWASSNPGVVSINSASGLATAIAAGSSSITATLNGITGSTTLVVQAAPLTDTTTPVPRGSQFSIWPAALPVIGDSGPDSAVELGVKFRSDTNGFITGIRFYKASANSGTHIGNLWTESGIRLATATFINETDSGWQQVNFPTPVAINANTVYVASYYTSAGHYSCDQHYFSDFGVNAMQRVPGNPVSGVNSVYSYGSISSFPGQEWRNSNYWVDVVFNASVISQQTEQSTKLTVTTTALPGGTLEAPYVATLEASGGTQPYTWSIVAGALPMGLSLDSSGVISGTPTATGSVAIIVLARDSGIQRQIATRVLSIRYTTADK